MRVIYKKSFRKSLSKQPLTIKKYFIKKLFLFTQNPKHPSLRVHFLKGQMLGLKSFDVTSDVRVHFYIKDNTYFLVNIGTHSQLY